MTLLQAPHNAMHEAQVRERLSLAARQPVNQRNALAGAAPEELNMDVGHRVYVLGLDAVREDAGIDRAVPVGWRYLLQQGDQVVAAAQTSTNAGGQAIFASFNSGPFVDSTSRALGEAEEYAGGAGDGEWEPRILHVPALHAMALWLHTEADATDEVLPLQPVPYPIKADRRYTVAEYLAALRVAAATVPPASPLDTNAG